MRGAPHGLFPPSILARGERVGVSSALCTAAYDCSSLQTRTLLPKSYNLPALLRPGLASAALWHTQASLPGLTVAQLCHPPLATAPVRAEARSQGPRTPGPEVVSEQTSHSSGKPEAQPKKALPHTGVLRGIPGHFLSLLCWGDL